MEINMLNENDVIEYVVKHLIENNYKIVDKKDTKQHGYDIIVKKNGKYLFIEAKGQTSSKDYTKRYQKEFTHAQKRVHVASAIYKSLRTANEKPDGEIGIAFPDTITHRNLVNPVLPSLKQLGIKLFWVNKDGIVTEE